MNLEELELEEVNDIQYFLSLVDNIESEGEKAFEGFSKEDWKELDNLLQSIKNDDKALEAVIYELVGDGCIENGSCKWWDFSSKDKTEEFLSNLFDFDLRGVCEDYVDYVYEQAIEILYDSRERRKLPSLKDYTPEKVYELALPKLKEELRRIITEYEKGNLSEFISQVKILRGIFEDVLEDVKFDIIDKRRKDIAEELREELEYRYEEYFVDEENCPEPETRQLMRDYWRSQLPFD